MKVNTKDLKWIREPQNYTITESEDGVIVDVVDPVWEIADRDLAAAEVTLRVKGSLRERLK